MDAHLGSITRPLRWLFEPARPVSVRARAFLLSQLLGAPAAALMGSFCALIVLVVAALRSDRILFDVLIVAEATLMVARVVDWRLRRIRLARSRTGSISIDPSVALSFAWCSLQGVVAFILMQGDDPVLQVLSATVVMALLGPICARNYAAPRFSLLLVAVCDLPFMAGALLNAEPLLALIALMTPPFYLGAMSIIAVFHSAMLSTLEAKEANRHLAAHDSLTGILNRHGMDEALKDLGADDGRTLALLSIDLDGFKQVNDTHGHGAGDLVLIEVARRIRTAVRDGDLVARMGGDEFMIVLRDMAPDAIPPVAMGLIEAISGTRIAISPETQVPIGASIGYACLPQDAATTVEMRLRADRALYDAKDAGKGTARRYRSPDGTAPANDRRAIA